MPDYGLYQDMVLVAFGFAVGFLAAVLVNAIPKDKDKR